MPNKLQSKKCFFLCFWWKDLTIPLTAFNYNQLYLKWYGKCGSRVSTQINTSQHESAPVWHEITRVRYESKWELDTSQHEFYTSPTKINTNQQLSCTCGQKPWKIHFKNVYVQILVLSIFETNQGVTILKKPQDILFAAPIRHRSVMLMSYMIRPCNIKAIG